MTSIMYIESPNVYHVPILFIFHHILLRSMTPTAVLHLMNSDADEVQDFTHPLFKQEFWSLKKSSKCQNICCKSWSTHQTTFMTSNESLCLPRLVQVLQICRTDDRQNQRVDGGSRSVSSPTDLISSQGRYY